MSLVPTPGPLAPGPAQPAGQGAEADQYTRARAAFTVGLVGQPVGNRHLSGRTAGAAAFVDMRSPQQFTSHPSIDTIIDSTAAGIDTAAAHLPGRGVWEPDAATTGPV